MHLPRKMRQLICLVKILKAEGVQLFSIDGITVRFAKTQPGPDTQSSLDIPAKHDKVVKESLSESLNSGEVPDDVLYYSS